MLKEEITVTLRLFNKTEQTGNDQERRSGNKAGNVGGAETGAGTSCSTQWGVVK